MKLFQSTVYGEKLSPFANSGAFINGKVFTAKTTPNYDGVRTVLGDVLQNGEVTKEFFVPKEEYPKWEYLKGAKKELERPKAVLNTIIVKGP